VFNAFALPTIEETNKKINRQETIQKNSEQEQETRENNK
jgi:hypothetical protein